MTIQWPDERDRENRQSFGIFSVDPKTELPELLKACHSGLSDDFGNAVEWMVQQGGDINELEQRMSVISNKLELLEFPESVNLLMVWACAESLAKSPSLQTWKNVRKLKNNSWQLEYWLSDAIMVYVDKNPSAKGAFIGLAKLAFEALDGFQLMSEFDRHNQERERFRVAWNENCQKLDEIWWGLRWWDEMNYQEEFPLFKVFARLDSAGFLKVVYQSRNPYLVRSAFVAVGIYYKFSLWKDFVLSAPLSFEQDGKWNGSVVMPLLLVTAHSQIVQASKSIPYLDALDSEVERVKKEITDLTEAVVTVLAERQDALPLFARWSTWLMRQLLMQGIKEANNVRSSAFVDAALVEAIGRKSQGKVAYQESPFDASTWEAWCYRAVLTSHASNGFISSPDYAKFLDEWKITLDDWSNEKGKKLRESSDLFSTMTKEIPGDAAHYLAYPIATSEFPVSTWIELWNRTQPLCEIVEFGDSDASGSDEYRIRGEAGRLLLLAFCIGLAILDQCVKQCPAGDSQQGRDLAKLHESLALAVREMREIDDTLNREQWLQTVQHLAVRRLIWEDRTINSKTGENERPCVFLPTDKPTFSDYLNETRNDIMELLAILQMAMLNEPNDKVITDKLQIASINPSTVIAMVKRLNVISDRRYPVDMVQLKVIQARLENAKHPMM